MALSVMPDRAASSEALSPARAIAASRSLENVAMVLVKRANSRMSTMAGLDNRQVPPDVRLGPRQAAAHERGGPPDLPAPRGFGVRGEAALDRAAQKLCDPEVEVDDAVVLRVAETVDRHLRARGEHRFPVLEQRVVYLGRVRMARRRLTGRDRVAVVADVVEDQRAGKTMDGVEFDIGRDGVVVVDSALRERRRSDGAEQTRLERTIAGRV